MIRKFKEGMGTTLMGSILMLLCLTIIIVFTQVFLMRNNGYDTQNAIDSIADGTAVYMASEGGDYEGASAKVEEIRGLIRDTTGVEFSGDITLDQEDLEENDTVTVSGITVNPFISSLGSNGREDYTITKTASTKFFPMGYGGGDLVAWMVSVAEDDTHGYSQPNRTFNPDVDCSSFVYYGLLNSGYTAEQLGGSSPFTTGEMPSILMSCGFHQLPYNPAILQPGDILWTPGHTGVYAGNGQTVEAHSHRHHFQSDGRTPIPGDQDGTEVNVSPLSSSSGWQFIYRK